MQDTDIVVTGSNGLAGSRAVDYFADSGYQVLGIDLDRPPGERPNAEFRPADVTDAGELYDLLLEADPAYVLHFAGLRSDRGAGNTIFETNVVGTYNVLEAAGRAGADVVWASSEAAYGRLLPDNPLSYAPIDESHPTRPSRPYGLSKRLGEAAASGIARRYGVSVVSMRATYIRYPGNYWEGTADPDADSYDGAFRNLYSYVDIRDVLSFLEATIGADIDGHKVFNVAARDNRAGIPTETIVETVYGRLPERCDLTGEESVFSIRKARTELGWEPRHDWRSAATDEPLDPSFL